MNRMLSFPCKFQWQNTIIAARAYTNLNIFDWMNDFKMTCPRRRLKRIIFIVFCFLMIWFLDIWNRLLCFISNRTDEPSDVINNKKWMNQDQKLIQIRLIYGGLCWSSSKYNELILAFCNPNRNDHSFHLSIEGVLIKHQGTDPDELLCVTTKQSKLTLQKCGQHQSILFSVDDGFDSYIQITDPVTGVKKCVNATYSPRKRKDIIGIPKNGSVMHLSDCTDKQELRIEAVDENSFRIDRMALIIPNSPLPVHDQNCTGELCHLNERHGPIKTVITDGEECLNASDCVTVVTKTTRRPLLVLRMARSIRENLGYDMPIITVDDGPEGHGDEVMGNMTMFPRLQYHISDDEDLGISQGRNLALSLVKTKYTLFVDDDNLFNEQTSLEVALHILETTDATAVGGTYSGNQDFSGFLRLNDYGPNKVQILKLYKGSCMEANLTVPGFPQCVDCDLTSNIFLARTHDMREIGGWSKELKVGEHKDIFMRLKAAGKKVVYCPQFQVFNKRAYAKSELTSKDYYQRRFQRKKQMEQLFCNRWNIGGVVEVGKNQLNYSSLIKMTDSR